MKNAIVAACHSEWRPCVFDRRVRQRVLRHVGITGVHGFFNSKGLATWDERRVLRLL